MINLFTNMWCSEECVVCLADVPSITFVPCNHACSCSSCSEMIKDASMSCPLCRQEITERLQGVTPSSNKMDVTEFKEKHREEYVTQLNAYRVRSNAGYKGKGKQARAVASHMGSELEQREMETKGTERLLAKNVVFVGDDKVTYKVGRRKVEEHYEYNEHWEIPEDVAIVLDVATIYPDMFWSFYKDCDGKKLYDYITLKI